jgi:hypothetical protein
MRDNRKKNEKKETKAHRNFDSNTADIIKKKQIQQHQKISQMMIGVRHILRLKTSKKLQ